VVGVEGGGERVGGLCMPRGMGQGAVQGWFQEGSAIAIADMGVGGGPLNCHVSCQTAVFLLLTHVA
jgi:hypothetical protein